MNVVVAAGSYYLTAVLLVPFWLLTVKLLERGDRTLPWSAVTITSGIATGLLAGALVTSPRVLSWSIGIGVMVAFQAWSSNK
jgi:hypothetical protein